jgi:hypothetical protein
MSPAFGGAQTSVTKRIARNRAPKRYRVLRGVTMRPAADGNRLFLLVGWRGRKKDLLKELEEALNTVQTVQYPSNVELVRKYYDKIDPAL